MQLPSGLKLKPLVTLTTWLIEELANADRPGCNVSAGDQKNNKTAGEGRGKKTEEEGGSGRVSVMNARVQNKSYLRGPRVKRVGSPFKHNGVCNARRGEVMKRGQGESVRDSESKRESAIPKPRPTLPQTLSRLSNR